MIRHRFFSLLCIMVSLFLVDVVQAIDNPHFYRANFFWQEPRLERNWLSTGDFLLAGGSTRKAFNQHGKRTALLNIFGLHEMQVLGQNVPNLDPANFYDEILLNLLALPTNGNFGKLLFKGDFSIVEGVINGYQNLVNGFFLQAYLPIRHLSIRNIQFVDKSPEEGFPNKNTPQWLQFLGNFTPLLAHFNREISTVNEVGTGDFSFLGGWTLNYQDSCYADYYDVTAKVGILFPTSKRKSLTNPFDLPLGYDGFYGLPFKFDCSMGYWEWVTCGAHIGALFLFDRKKTIALKTSSEQNGFITITQGDAKIDPGTIWDIAAYVKADHFFRGLSLIVGYCYTLKDSDCIEPVNTAIFPKMIVNSDQQFRSWQMHVIHWFLEYDFARQDSQFGPRLGLFYNWIVGGIRIFDTNMTVASLGIDISWCY